MVKTRKKNNKHKKVKMDGIDKVVDYLMAQSCIREVKTGLYQRVSSTYAVGSVIKSTRPANGEIPLVYVGKPKCGQSLTVYPVNNQKDQVYRILRSQYGI